MGSKLKIGKIDPDILGKLISDYTHWEDRVLIGAGIGEDAAIIDMGTSYLVAKTDPITHVTGEIGHYAVNINANDIAAMGGKPKWFLATILMPETSSAEELKRIFSQLSESCKTLGVLYCGGHTEITRSVNNPVVIGQMLGEVQRDNLKPTSAACQGDDLIMTKSSAIEATAIIALEKAKELRGHLEDRLLERAQNYLHSPGISVVDEANIVSSIKDVHALHDPTEGGIFTGIFEVATASNLGVEVYYDKIPISEETRILCGAYDVDPLGTFASGSLLIAVSPSATKDVISRLAAESITATRIGIMSSKEKGMRLIKKAKNLPLPVYHQDELSKIFG
jgi:hydrogenase expression/formation protein HypE